MKWRRIVPSFSQPPIVSRTSRGSTDGFVYVLGFTIAMPTETPHPTSAEVLCDHPPHDPDHVPGMQRTAARSLSVGASRSCASVECQPRGVTAFNDHDLEVTSGCGPLTQDLMRPCCNHPFPRVLELTCQCSHAGSEQRANRQACFGLASPSDVPRPDARGVSSFPSWL